jgi:hypothetical protein
VSPTVRIVVTPEYSWVSTLAFARRLNSRRPSGLRASFVTIAAVDSLSRIGGTGRPSENRWACALINPGRTKCPVRSIRR